MTLDTAILRAQWEAIREQQGSEAFAMIAHVGDGIALLDALDEMRTERDSWQADVESLHRDLAHSMDRIAEEMAAVEAERERVRVLTEGCKTLSVWAAVHAETLPRNHYLFDAIRAAEAALATAGGEGATGALWAE